MTNEAADKRDRDGGDSRFQDLIGCVQDRNAHGVQSIWADMVDGGVDRLNFIATLAEFVESNNNTTVACLLAGMLSNNCDAPVQVSEKRARCIFRTLLHHGSCNAVDNYLEKSSTAKLLVGLSAKPGSIRAGREAAQEHCKEFIESTLEILRAEGKVVHIQGVDPYQRSLSGVRRR